MQGEVTMTVGEGLQICEEGHNIVISQRVRPCDSFNDLSEAQQAEMWRALMSVMMMGVVFRNEYGFFVLEPCGNTENASYDVDTPEKLLNVCNQIGNREWVCGDPILPLTKDSESPTP